MSSIIPQFFRHIIILNVSLFSLFLFLVIISLACEKIDSADAEVAEIARYFRAKIDKIENFIALNFQYSKTFV